MPTIKKTNIIQTTIAEDVKKTSDQSAEVLKAKDPEIVKKLSTNTGKNITTDKELTTAQKEVNELQIELIKTNTVNIKSIEAKDDNPNDVDLEDGLLVESNSINRLADNIRTNELNSIEKILADQIPGAEALATVGARLENFCKDFDTSCSFCPDLPDFKGIFDGLIDKQNWNDLVDIISALGNSDLLSALGKCAENLLNTSKEKLGKVTDVMADLGDSKALNTVTKVMGDKAKLGKYSIPDLQKKVNKTLGNADNTITGGQEALELQSTFGVDTVVDSKLDLPETSKKPIYRSKDIFNILEKSNNDPEKPTLIISTNTSEQKAAKQVSTVPDRKFKYTFSHGTSGLKSSEVIYEPSGNKVGSRSWDDPRSSHPSAIVSVTGEFITWDGDIPEEFEQLNSLLSSDYNKPGRFLTKSEVGKKKNGFFDLFG